MPAGGPLPTALPGSQRRLAANLGSSLGSQGSRHGMACGTCAAAANPRPPSLLACWRIGQRHRALDKAATLKRITTHWMPELRRLGVHVPVMLVGCKSDIRPADQTLHQVEAAARAIAGALRPVFPAMEFWLGFLVIQGI